MSRKKKVIADPNAPYGTCADGTPRKKSGPPPLMDAARPRSIRVGQAEWTYWSTQAQRRGVTISELIRELMAAELGTPAKPSRA